MKTESNRSLVMLAARWLVGTTTSRAATTLFVAVLAAMLWIPTAMQAQTRDVITITGAKAGAADADGTFKAGAASTEYPGVYVVDLGDASVEEMMFTVTLSRPQGATAQRAATITLSYMCRPEMSVTETFEPGETEKTVELNAPLFAATYESTGPWSGNIPALFAVSSTFAEMENDVLMLKVNRTPTEEVPQCTLATKLEVLQNTQGNDWATGYEVTRWGEYILFRFFLSTHVKISVDSRYVFNARSIDHTGMGPDDDDFGLARTHEVALTPLNAGAVSSEAWYLYRPSPDEYLHSLDDNMLGNMHGYTDRKVKYPVLEVGPFEVANPAEDAVRYIFYSRSDLPEESTNSVYPVNFYVDGLMPEFSNVRINKTSFKSGETMVITATMDNWPFVKRGQDTWFKKAFGVTLDDNATLEACRYTFDEQTGQVTYYVTAPTVDETTTFNVDFGPAKEKWGAKEILTKAASCFAVSVSPDAATPNLVTQMEFVGLPTEGSAIILMKEYGLIVQEKQYNLFVNFSPADATDANQVAYSVANSGGASAFIEYGDNFNGSVLHTGKTNGTITVTASLPSGLSVSRTFSVVVGNGDEQELLAMPKPLNRINHYLIGTVFPQFQFEVNNPDNWPIDDAVTVNFTHANGTTWTENYSLKKLKSRQTDRGTTTYDLPFSFTDDHPDVTADSQIGKAVITAQVLLTVPTTEGPKETIECVAMLTSGLKQISFGDYSEMTAYWNEVHPFTFTSEVMYLPRMGFTVGYEIPELGIKETYNNLTDGDKVPEWLELQADDYYYRANITVKQTFDTSVSQYHFYTLAQRSYNPDEVMLREMTTIANMEYVGAEGHLLYRVNGKDVAGDLTFDNGEAMNDFVENTLLAQGFLESGNEDYHGKEIAQLLNATCGIFTVYDDVYEGADVTLKRGNDVIQTIQGYKGVFKFIPPADGNTYTVEVYYPGYNRRYTSTFVSHPFTNIYRINMRVYPGGNNTWYDMLDIISYYNKGKLKEVIMPRGDDYREWHKYIGYLYLENPNNFYLSSKPRIPSVGTYCPPVRIGKFPGVPVKYDVEPILSRWRNVHSMNEAKSIDYTPDDSYRSFIQWRYFDWDWLGKDNSVVSVINTKGEPITNATVNYANADSTMTIQGAAGSTTYDSVLEAYQIETDPNQYAEYIEVVAPGYLPKLSAMYQRDYDYNSPENKGKVRRHVIVLEEGNAQGQVSGLTLETLKRSGNIENNEMQAVVNSDNLLMLERGATLFYSETGDFETVTKHLNGGKFGEGWSGLKWAHLTGQMACPNDYDASQLRLQSSEFDIQPVLTKVFTQEEFSTLSQNYCLFDFDLTDQVPNFTTVQPVLKSGDETVAELPSMCNYSVDQMAMEEANNIDMEPGGLDLREVDNQAEDNGTDMKDMGKAFDSFSFQLPPVLPFTVNIERNGDFFIVRAVCEKNFIPGGQVMDAIDKIGDYQYFEEQFEACMDAVHSAQPADDDFFDDIPTFPSAFLGVKGYLSGVGHYNPETGKLDINFYDGGITLEASAAAQANVSFGIGAFGMSIDAKIAMTMGLINTAAAQGDVASTKIDFMFDFQTRLKICAWVYAGIDLWIAKAVCGVRGGACFDLQSRTYFVSGHEGMRTTLQAQMEAFAEARFLFWTRKKTWPIFKAYKEYLEPNDPTNPFHPDFEYGDPIFESRRNVTKGYKRLKRKVIADLGKPIISNVSGMARPTYLMDGTSLLFNNLKTAKDYNDDRLQVYTNGSKEDMVDTGVDAPMYDFSTARNTWFEMVAFEQLEDKIDGNAIDAMTERDQTKTASEKSRIHLAWRERAENAPGAGMGNWNTMEVGDIQENIAYVNPVVAVPPYSGDITKMNKGVAAWQQGVVKFNDEGSRYIDGSLMLKRHSVYDMYSEPIEIKRINRRNVPVDYQMALKDDSVLVMMALQQDVNNQNKGTSVAYITVAPDNKVRERYTMIEGSKPQMVNVGGATLVAYLKQNEDGRDIVLNTVNMKGEPTGKLSGPLGMKRRMVTDYKLVAQNGEEASLHNVALLWSQSDEEKTDNADGTMTVNYKNRLYASLLCSHDNQLYFSAPVEIATMPDDVSLVSMDGVLEGLDMKVAYCVANEEDGAAVLESELTFTNDIDYKMTFNPYDMANDSIIPIKLTVVNNGCDPIKRVNWKVKHSSTEHIIYDYQYVSIMPQETAELEFGYRIPGFFDGTIDYEVEAEFGTSNSNALKSRRLGAKARPMRVQKSGTQMDVRQVDMALKMLSKRTTDGVTTIVAEVNNASLLPLADGVSVKVGLYDSPLATEKAAGTTEVTVSTNDLYDANADQKNKVKIVTLTAQAPDLDQVLFLRTTPMQGSEVLRDVRPDNNVLPVKLVGKCIPGDINNDGKVDVSDYIGVANYILGNTPTGFVKSAADVNGDGKIDVSDYIGIANIILTGNVYGNNNQSRIYRNGIIE